VVCGKIKKEKIMVNVQIIVGRLGRPPMLKYLPSGDAVAEFSVAVTNKWTDKKGQKQEETEWFSVEAFNKLAETCNQHLIKGSQVYVEGKTKTDHWEKEGVKRQKSKIVAKVVQFLDNKNDSQ
tara:strand:- start:189 stop:557 length:369 start_codon:yes stop_codon:yes gene_type:complete